MCVQCMLGAMTAGAGASGARAWLATRFPTWMSPSRRRQVSRVLLVAGVLAAGIVGPSAGH
jgi:hypothetical protein